MQQRLQPDRRRVARGGRRPTDTAGRFPPILVADSFEDARRLYVRYLNKFHFDVIEAFDGVEACLLTHKQPPHVILTEWPLPTQLAAGVKRWLSEGEGSREVPMILLAGEDQPDARMPPRASVLIKPFPLATMLEAIRKALRQSGEALVSHESVSRDVVS